MFGKIQSELTQHYAKRWGGVTDTEEYTACGISRTVYWFHDESNRLGDYSPFGTLFMNEQTKANFSEDVVDYVFLHEVGHDQIGFIGRGLFSTFYLTFGLFFLSGIIVFPSTLVVAFQFAPSTIMLPAYLILAIGVTIAAILPLILASWIDEALAEFFAISKIGQLQYQSVTNELKEQSDSGILHKIRHRIQYPPVPLILWIARKRGIGNQ